MACLGDDTIAALLEGGLPHERAQQARAHLGTCDACRALVANAIDATPEASATWRDGVIAGRYRVERPLGEGGMGRVVVARQLGLDRQVAIKIVRPELARDPHALRRFQREARLVAQLASPHVVRVHDIGTLETGEPFLVMEMLDGEDLATRLARGPVPLDQAIAWIGSACDALDEAHRLGIVHRDIKPSNLFVTRQGRLVVVDFGLAKLTTGVASSSVTADGVVLGSPHYMAPEQVRGARDVDARADVWSLAATVVHLVTGQPPFPGPTMQAVLANILTGELPRLDGLPPAIAAAIRRALARDPAARFATAGEFAAALRGTTPVRRANKGRRIALAAAAVAVVATVAVVAFVAGRSSADGSEGATTTASSTSAGGSTTPGASTTPNGSTTPGGSTTQGASTSPGASNPPGGSSTQAASSTMPGASPTNAGASTPPVASSNQAASSTTPGPSTNAGTSTTSGGSSNPGSSTGRVASTQPSGSSTTPGTSPNQTSSPNGSGASSNVQIGTRYKAPVSVGSNVVIGSTPSAHAPSQGRSDLLNVSQDRLEQRLAKLGWTVKRTNHEHFQCEYNWTHSERGDTRTNDYKWADVTLFTCPSPEITASEVARMAAHSKGDWLAHDDTKILIVSANKMYGLGSDETLAKPLLAQLLQPQ